MGAERAKGSTSREFWDSNIPASLPHSLENPVRMPYWVDSCPYLGHIQGSTLSLVSFNKWGLPPLAKSNFWFTHSFLSAFAEIFLGKLSCSLPQICVQPHISGASLYLTSLSNTDILWSLVDPNLLKLTRGWVMLVWREFTLVSIYILRCSCKPPSPHWGGM